MGGNKIRIVVPFLAALLAAPLAFGVVIGQIDDFEDGTVQNWVVGVGGMGVHPAPPQNVATGGPAGAGDNFLLLTALGGQEVPAGRLSVLNLAQWSGDYRSAGIAAIEMDLNNFGPGDLALRLLFEDPMMGPPTNIAFSSAAFLLPAGSGWVHAVFPVALSALTTLMGSELAVLQNTTAIRIFHSSADTFPGEAVQVMLGVDNIRAVPEPGTILLLAGFLLGLAARRDL